jgi:spore maturation protein CgeB
MKFVLFYHSFVSCWNHGNAHFLRGFARELIRRGHQVVVHEPENGWSRTNALADGGAAALAEASRLVPGVVLRSYPASGPDYDQALDGADAVIVHEWTAPDIVAALGARRRLSGFRLLFHDTHHRAVTAPHEIDAFALDQCDAVLAFGEVLREVYARRGHRAFTWHEAADVALFQPRPEIPKTEDVAWVGNWGDDERSAELHRFLIAPVASCGLSASIYGVRYPEEIRNSLAQHGITYRGWLPNHRVSEVLAQARVTLHVPRRPYVEALPGIPTIRVMEALACGIPLIMSPWRDEENLFDTGCYLMAANETEMQAALRLVIGDRDLAADLVRRGLEVIHHRHTCAHRVDELFAILDRLGGSIAAPAGVAVDRRTLQEVPA